MEDRLSQKFLKLNSTELEDLRMQFQTFDTNQDGVIDYEELMQVFDDLGDTSDEKMRNNYFNEVDEDGSGAFCRI